MGLSDALKAADERARQEHLKTIRDRRIQYASDTYGFAQNYDNAIVITGYAAFFGLWAGIHGDVSPTARLVTAALIGFSLVLYIVWHIMQMLTRQKFEFRKAEAFEFEDDPERFNAVWDDIDQRHARAQMRTIRIWPWTFVPAVALGLLGGLLLVYSAAAPAIGLPQLGR